MILRRNISNYSLGIARNYSDSSIESYFIKNKILISKKNHLFQLLKMKLNRIQKIKVNNTEILRWNIMKIVIPWSLIINFMFIKFIHLMNRN